MTETELRPNSAGIPYTLLLRIEAIGFPTCGLSTVTGSKGLLYRVLHNIGAVIIRTVFRGCTFRNPSLTVQASLVVLVGFRTFRLI